MEGKAELAFVAAHLRATCVAERIAHAPHHVSRFIHELQSVTEDEPDPLVVGVLNEARRRRGESYFMSRPCQSDCARFFRRFLRTWSAINRPPQKTAAGK